VTRRDEQRVADLLDAAGELRMIVDRGRQAFDDESSSVELPSACWRSSARPPTH
jgi:hypothetical protein